ncbi:hypothetical protein AAIM60_11070 [Pseudomonas lijiangensis]|uniref:hypothetical protein n=1 Tax=Pseudomonas syringae group TaxID=136849 RepID=UPI0018E5FF47|nr:hypothetical protein [Pseudomonas cichorii]MBI6852186.1 hypothetical protein [Pseudomonas cichorii]
MAALFNIPRTFSRVRVLALLIGGLAFSNANAALEIHSSNADNYDKIVTSFNDYGRGTALRNANITVGDIQEVKKNTESNTKELENLKKIIEGQAKLIEELKRDSKSSVSSSSSSDSEIASLKRKVDEQSRSIDKFEGQVNDLKRSSGSSSSSSASELSSLKREVSDQERELSNVKRSLDDLSRKVK